MRRLRETSIAFHFAIRAYCLMPDHFHALVYGLADSSDLLAFVKHLKQTTGHDFYARRYHTLWQKRFFDHILRPADNAAAIAGYIWMNPVRQALCKDMRDYPYSGSFTLDWKSEVAPMEEWVPHWRPKRPA